MKLKPGAIADSHTSHGNLTGSWRTFKPVYKQKDCTGCKLCVINCPEGCVFEVEDRKYTCNLKYCKGCGICAVECHVNDIEMILEDK